MAAALGIELFGLAATIMMDNSHMQIAGYNVPVVFYQRLNNIEKGGKRSNHTIIF